MFLFDKGYVPVRRGHASMLQWSVVFFVVRGWDSASVRTCTASIANYVLVFENCRLLHVHARFLFGSDMFLFRNCASVRMCIGFMETSC